MKRLVFFTIFVSLLLVLNASASSEPCSTALTTVQLVNRSAPQIESRLQAAHGRLVREGNPRITFVTVVSPEYDFPSFNLSTADLAGYLRHKHQELKKPGALSFIEPDITFAQTPHLAQSIDFTLAQLRRTKPHIIGISAKIGSQDNLLALLKHLKAEPWAQASIVIVGNVLSTYSHDVFSEKYPHVLFAIGDGELTINALYEGLLSGVLKLSEVPGLAYRNAAGNLIRNPRQYLNPSEQNWLPALDMVNTTIAHKADMTIRATTGCNAHCTFCSIRGKDVRAIIDDKDQRIAWNAYPAERTARLFQILEKRGFRYVNLTDDEFGNTSFDFLEHLSDLLIAQRNQVKFNVSMRLDAFWTPEMPPHERLYRRTILRKLKQAGLDQLFVGAESGSPTQLKRYGKGYDARVNREGIRILLEEGMRLSVGFIPFDQLVNRYEVQENLQFLQTAINQKTIADLVTSPLNVMHVQRATGYQDLLDRLGLLGPLEDNLTFHHSKFIDPRMEKIAHLGLDWFRKIINLRYPVLQLTRNAKDNNLFRPDIHARTTTLMRQMHALDIELIGSLLNAFPQDEGDLLFQDKQDMASAFKKEDPRVTQARTIWAQSLEAVEPHLTALMSKFNTKRSLIEKQMEQLLKDAYKP